MHEARAVAEILRAAEAAAEGARIGRIAVRIEGDEHLTPQLVRTHLRALAARSHPSLDVDVIVDRAAPGPGIRLLTVDVEA
ncbi:MAG: hypothetical protein R3290_10235 [Acidimicrobiia bacterium]|nr:hypothetical protein [Acidimicrobiia bacterium]